MSGSRLSGPVRGVLYIMASAVLFGIAPSLTAFSYAGGNNPVNMAFLRALLPLPLFLFFSRGSLPLLLKNARGCALLGFLSFACTLMLYSSYAYLPVGIATTVHFLYPLYVVLCEAAARRQLPRPGTCAALVLSLAGILLFMEGSASGGFLTGLLFAWLSGVLYAAYILALDRRSGDLPLFPRLAGMSVAGALLCGTSALLTGRFTLSLEPRAWVFTLLAIGMTAVAATSLFQEGVRLADGTQAALFSLFEPLTSILVTAVISRSVLSPARLLGCVLILAGLGLHLLSERRSR